MSKIFRRCLIGVGLFLACGFVHAAADRRVFQARGEVLALDPIFHQIIIRHKPIKGFPSEEDSIFSVASTTSMDGVAPRDVVDFSISEQNGDVQLIGIKKTGTALPPIHDKFLIVSQTAHGFLEKVDDVAEEEKNPASAIAGGAANALDNAVDGATHVYKEGKKLTDHEW